VKARVQNCRVEFRVTRWEIHRRVEKRVRIWVRDSVSVWG